MEPEQERERARLRAGSRARRPPEGRNDDNFLFEDPEEALVTLACTTEWVIANAEQLGIPARTVELLKQIPELPMTDPQWHAQMYAIALRSRSVWQKILHHPRFRAILSGACLSDGKPT